MNALVTSRIAIALIAFGTGTLTAAFLLRHSGYGEYPIVSAPQMPSLSKLYLNTVMKSVTGTSVVTHGYALIHSEYLCMCASLTIKQVNFDVATVNPSVTQGPDKALVTNCRYSFEHSGLRLWRRPRGRPDSEVLRFGGVDT